MERFPITGDAVHRRRIKRTAKWLLWIAAGFYFGSMLYLLWAK